MHALQNEHMHSFIVCAFLRNPAQSEHFRKMSRSDLRTL
jgi:hypothetical protein